MLDYQRRGSVPAKHHITHRRPDGAGVYYEECFTRQGFDGAFSILYHAFATTDDTETVKSSRGWPAPVSVEPQDETVRRRLFDGNKIPVGGCMVDSRIAMLFCSDLVILLARPTQSDDVYFSNGDGDELVYVYGGKGRLESSFGWLPFQTGDYVWVPKGVIHRWHLEGEGHAFLVMEARKELRIPKQFRNASGQLRMDAPYCHRDFVRPEGAAWEPSMGESGPCTVVYKVRDRFSQRTMPHHPLDIVGWDGNVYPVAFPIGKYQPKTGLVHLPPTSHLTFAGEGFVVCSFVPRIVDFHPEAIPCPYPHTNVDCDEVLLYLDGNFTSRKGVGPGCMSLHPMGVPHGPHPGAYERSIGAQTTTELAVMIDTFAPLAITANALALETREYHDSWAPR
ncbi:MAG: homogentisate 1,2-dioxygenase [Deltaproteobacteria bacterium]|nr:homogentisate 1,2-dioxygenase [Deltaproteobacteria bacterium]